MKQVYFLLILLSIGYGQVTCQHVNLPYNFVQYHIVDLLRKEIYPHNSRPYYREFMMHVWIPVIQKQCPLILFSHGLGDNFNGMTYTQLCEYCASRGYVVASVSHTYACKSIQFPDGYSSPYLFPTPFHHQTGKHMFDIETDEWVKDMICALDECEHQNNTADSLLYNKIDMTRIGSMGHSLGGSTALQLARKDNRVAAAINLDGPLYGDHAMIPIEKPVMMLIGSSAVTNSPLAGGGIPFHKEFMWRWYFNNHWLPQLNQFFASLSSDAYKITIDKIVHGTFSDEALYPDVVIIPWIIDAESAHAIIHSYVGAFFDHYLKGEDATLLQETISPWSNVTVEKKQLW